ncbi:MAG: hypothetical protein Q9184_003726 [Pyrenodesmia sp. 2 TL-2023]
MKGSSYVLPLCPFLWTIGLGSPIVTIPEDNVVEVPSYFAWINTWAAIGDSFAAGIGAGSTPKEADEVQCSRYGDAYPAILNDLMEIPQVSFKFLACTGATSAEIKDQAKLLDPGSLDLLSISAGGNDVGFSTVLKKCVYFPSSEAACEAAFDTATSLVGHDLQPNIESLLDAVLPVMKDDAIIVYTLYAQFFNDTDTACDDQSWVLFDPTGRSGKEFGLKLTRQKRQKMNQMVLAANERIKKAITSKRDKFESKKISIVIANWDAYVGKIKGRFCEEGATLNPDDNLSLVFQRQDQTPIFVPSDKKIIQTGQTKVETDLQAEEGLSRSFLPDSFTCRFHPNTLGQSIIAQVALAEIGKAKAEKLRAEENADTCILYPEPAMCKEDDRTVITHPRFDGAVSDFCRDKSDFTVTPLGSNKSLELRFSAIAGSSCGPSDCAQSMNNLYDECVYPAISSSEMIKQAKTLFLGSNDHGAYRGVTGPGYIGGEGSFSSKCGVYSFKMIDTTPKFPPGDDAVNPGGAIIKPWCSELEEPFVPYENLLAAVTEYCDHEGEPFFKGHKQITHTIGTGPETHIYMNAIDISKKAGDHYKYDDVCE